MRRMRMGIIIPESAGPGLGTSGDWRQGDCIKILTPSFPLSKIAKNHDFGEGDAKTAPV
jgi:hypothetical protein